MSERVAVYPGTFDPVTFGHMDIIWRATRIVDRLIVAVAVNPGKDPLFTVDERVALMEEEIKAHDGDFADRVDILPFDSLLMDFVNDAGAEIIIRGLRAVSDFEYEFQMAAMNGRLNPSVETVFLTASETHQFIASRFVKEIGRLGGDVGHFVSARVKVRLVEQLRSGGNG